MPFVSQAQARFMFSQHPKIAKVWASKTRSIKALPKRVKKYGKASYSNSAIMIARSMK